MPIFSWLTNTVEEAVLKEASLPEPSQHGAAVMTTGGLRRKVASVGVV